jgi:fibro-slime domain-containing protein
MNAAFQARHFDSIAGAAMRAVYSTAAAAFLAIAFLPPGARAQADNLKILPVTYHDFNGTHADFENPTCRGGTGMVQDTLGKDRKPVHLPGNLCADNALKDWFHDSPDNTRYCRTLTLTKQAGTLNTYEYDNKRFFPIDDVATNESKYKGGDGLIHNFHFCMEMHASFKYQGGEVFDFLGDDDVWVYVNNHLALDLGGLHEALPGTVNLDAQKDRLKISAGNYYNFDFFFCERQTSESDMKVTTNIDILPPPASGLHIADAQLNILGAGDTLTVPKGGGPAAFNGIKTSTEAQTLDCADVLTQVKTPISGNWTLGGVALPAGPAATVDPDAVSVGLHKLVFEKDGVRDSLWVNVPDLPTAAVPKADPPGRPFAGSLNVTLATATPGAAVHYTVDGTVPTSSSPLYSGPVVLTGTSTLKAIAVKAGYKDSPMMTESYAKVPARVVKGDLDVGLVKGVTESAPLPARANPDPIVVHGTNVCSNCGDPGIRDLLPTRDPAAITALGPTWKVKTKYPFRYSLFFYDNLGQFVNKAEGEVDPVRLEALRVPGSADDSVVVQLTFLPISREGNLIATGAYVMKGTLRIRSRTGLRGSGGEEVVLAPTERNIVSRFGYMRKAR